VDRTIIEIKLRAELVFNANYTPHLEEDILVHLHNLDIKTALDC